MCEKCLDTGLIVYRGEDGYDYADICTCVYEKEFKKRLRKSGLDQIVDDYSLDTYITNGTWQKSIKEKALNFIDNPSNDWFYIGGQVGSGKTHICTSIVYELIKKGYDAYYMMYRQDITELKHMTSNEFSEEYWSKVNYLKKVKVLYIDDLFKGSKIPTEADLRILFDIINHRYMNRDLITIISSERLIDDIIEIDEAIGTRIFQRSKEYNIKLAQNKKMNIRYLKEAIQ